MTVRSSTIAIYPGSFDPCTNGHIDIIHRSLACFERVVVAVANNLRKAPLFTLEQRLAHLRASIAHPRLEVDAFEGLLVDYAAGRQARIIVRGLRALADFEYEFQLSHMNRRLGPDIETLFMMTGEDDFFVSSSLVKEVASLRGDVARMVPEVVRAALEDKFGVPVRR